MTTKTVQGTVPPPYAVADATEKKMSDLLRYIPTTADLIINIKDYETFIQIAKNEERERIIKLLEDDFWHHISFSARGPDEEPIKYHDGECLGCRLIALIKGEQK